MPALVVRREPEVKCAVGSTPRRRNQHPVTFCDLPEVCTFEVEADMIPKDYDPPRLLKPKCEPSERRWGNAVDGFSDPIIDLAVARFKAVCLANGTGPVSRDDESWEPCPQLHPFSIEQVHEKEDRRLPVVIGETLCLILTITPDGFAPYKRGKLYREYKRVEFKSIPKEEFDTSEFCDDAKYEILYDPSWRAGLHVDLVDGDDPCGHQNAPLGSHNDPTLDLSPVSSFALKASEVGLCCRHVAR